MSNRETVTRVGLYDWLDWKENEVTKAFLQRLSTKLDAIMTAWATGLIDKHHEVWQARAVVYKECLDLAFSKDELVATQEEESE